MRGAPVSRMGRSDFQLVMSPEVAVQRAIARAERILPGKPAPDGERDSRWQAIISIGDYIETQPEAVWRFAHRWGKHAQADLRRAIATCLLEHLLEHHFELLFPRVRRAAMESPRFADTFDCCWSFGEAKAAKNAARVERLQGQLRRSRQTRQWATSPADAPDRSRRYSSRRSGARLGAGPAGDRPYLMPRSKLCLM